MADRTGRTRLDRRRYFPGDGKAAIAATALIFVFGLSLHLVLWALKGSGNGFVRDYIFLISFGVLSIAYGTVAGIALISKRRRSDQT